MEISLFIYFYFILFFFIYFFFLKLLTFAYKYLSKRCIVSGWIGLRIKKLGLVLICSWISVFFFFFFFFFFFCQAVT